MVQRGERCSKCGGKLVLDNGPRKLTAREKTPKPPTGSAA
jgi:hypothetical protein